MTESCLFTCNTIIAQVQFFVHNLHFHKLSKFPSYMDSDSVDNSCCFDSSSFMLPLPHESFKWERKREKKQNFILSDVSQFLYHVSACGFSSAD